MLEGNLMLEGVISLEKIILVVGSLRLESSFSTCVLEM
jgi:hypothetical protein